MSIALSVLIAFSFNQPNFCPSTTWYTDAITFANSSYVGTEPYGLFVDVNNTIYVANRQNNFVLVWFGENIYPNYTLFGNLNGPLSLFATLSGDLYVDNGGNSQVNVWPKNKNTSTLAMTISSSCYSIFVDITNSLYCSMTTNHQIAKKWLGDNGTTLTVVAGTGGCGSTANAFCYPIGVYVDHSLNMYVTDCQNNRVQMFSLGQTNAITILGTGAPGTITLNCPNAITFDANGYIFVGDRANNRIIGSGPYGYRCIFGCSQVAGSATNQLNSPRQFGFDTYGNLYVADQYNYRIQKIILASNSCSKLIKRKNS